LIPPVATARAAFGEVKHAGADYLPPNHGLKRTLIRSGKAPSHDFHGLIP
jgi:hypothetical protein